MMFFRCRNCIAYLLCVLLGMAPAASAGQRLHSVSVVLDNNYPPYVFQDSDGKLQGVLVDQWRLWEQKTGIRVEIHAMDWGEALQRMKAGEFDVIDTVFRTEDRSGWLDFSPPYVTIDVPIFFHKNISGINDAASLNGFVVGAKTGDSAVDLLRRSGIENLLLFNSYESVIRAAGAHKVNVFVVDEPPALYFLYKFGLHDQFRQSPPLYVGEFHRAVRKNNTELLQAVNAGFASISAEELRQIEKKWLGSSLGNLIFIKYVAAAGLIFACLIMLLVFWNRALRRAVSARTAELKTSEERFQAIYNSVNDSIFLHDGETGAILDVNQAMLDQTGYSKEEALRLTLEDLSLGEPPYSQNEAVGFIKQALAGEPQVFEWQARNKARTVYPCEVALKRCSIGNRTMVTAVVRDISDRKRLELQLQQAQKMEAIGTLAGGIAHDINNILAPILGYTELALKRGAVQEPQRGYLQQVTTAALRAKKLVRQILAFSRQSPGARTVLHPQAVVQEALGLVRASLPSSIEIREVISVDCGTILADPTQLHQIVINLCTNGYQAMRETGGVLEVRLHNVTVAADEARRSGGELAPGGYVLLQVGDSGCGMEPDTLTRIFEPYFTTKAMGEGTGLGLSVVHGIVRSHQGQIAVSSEAGQGTTFKVYLPRLGEAPGGEAPERDQEGIPGGRERLLVVDDEESIREFLQILLERLGYSVTVSGGSLEALALIERDPASLDLLITDMTMPHMNGSELSRRALALRPDLPVILCTGFSELIDQESARTMGIRAFVLKPVVTQELARTVRSLLDAQGRG
ncbi:MAG: hypothetical protein BWK76_09950 [Desulfobulbaceae bacterium A2]|nr:MAG: hypothetical protein BWK76_09950 [Desulfobulbaceae bacterium A2]